MGINQEFQENASEESFRKHPRFETVDFNSRIWSEETIAATAGPLAYALNLPQIGGARPGHISIRPHSDDSTFYPTPYPRTREELKHRLNHDGLLYVGNVLPENDKEHVIAFFARDGDNRPHTEMVIARRDSNGLWSTKTSGGCGSPFYPTQTDFTGKPITDPLKADFCNFINFLGFAIVPDEGLLYYTRVPLGPQALAPFPSAQTSPTFGTP